MRDFHAGEHRLTLVSRADQAVLLNRFGQQDGSGIAILHNAHQALGCTDCVRALLRNFSRCRQGSRARVVDHVGCQTQGTGFVTVDDAPAIDQLTQPVGPHEATREGHAAHVGHQPPFDFHD